MGDSPENHPRLIDRPPQSWKDLTKYINLMEGKDAHAISPDSWFLVPWHYAIFIPSLQILCQYKKMKQMEGE